MHQENTDLAGTPHKTVNVTHKTVNVTHKTVKVIHKTVRVTHKTVTARDKTVKVIHKTVKVTPPGLLGPSATAVATASPPAGMASSPDPPCCR